jgi:hypothetical protein
MEEMNLMVKFATFGAIIAAAIAFAVPAFAQSCPSSCGSYTVNAQYATNKHSVLSAGGSVTWLAIGMLETNTLDSNYTYGDGKTGDSANFGFMKNNWYMYRVSVSNFKGQSSSQYNNGAIANGNYGNAVNFANQCVSHFGWTSFWEVQRGGQGRIGNWNADTAEYYNGVNWIQGQINSNYSKYSTDQTRFWADVPAI